MVDENMKPDVNLPPRPVPPSADLRDMLRRYLVRRSLACMSVAGERREQAVKSSALEDYRQAVCQSVKGFYGALPAGKDMLFPEPLLVSSSIYERFRIENVLFETYPGWQVNATVYIPQAYSPPFPVVIVPVGHSGKQFESYQLPCQYFASAGYLAICFDPPGQASEKQPGNDHFNDGVRDYLIGETSSRYFISDAIRCVDYAYSRKDTDVSRGVAMTGVSGGGTTTTFAALLDERISVTGPSCCVAPLADLDISQCYSGCPESHQIGRYAKGVDEVDLLCAASPVPCFLMAGAADEIYHIEDTRRLADIVAGFYAAAEAPERFQFSVDPGGHGYPLEQAVKFTRFMNRWLLEDEQREVPALSNSAYSLLPYESLRCYPRTDVNMRTLATAAADRLAESRNASADAVRTAARTLVDVELPVSTPEFTISDPFQVWTHDWHSVMLRPEAEIELPATLLTARNGKVCSPAILHIDDGGRHRALYRQGPLATAIRFLDRTRPGFHLLTVDTRGWGDSEPTMVPYEMAGWGSIDRHQAYSSAALGDPVMMMRVRDGLAALAWLQSLPEVDSKRILISGAGEGAIIALHIAALSEGLGRVLVSNALSSFRSLIEAERYPWSASTFIPGVLKAYDLPDLAGAVSAPVDVYHLLNGEGLAAQESEIEKWHAFDNIRIIPGTVSFLESMDALENAEV